MKEIEIMRCENRIWKLSNKNPVENYRIIQKLKRRLRALMNESN